MWAILLCVAVLASIASLTAWVYRRTYDEKPLVIFGGLMAVILWLVFCVPVVCLVGPVMGGFWPGYSVGQRTGYITKMSRRGIVWKTIEGELQVGVGQQASLQDHFAFSAADCAIVDRLYKLEGTGRKVTLHYNEWLVAPAWLGDSGYIITSIDE